jgi:hypothetical protein
MLPNALLQQPEEIVDLWELPNNLAKPRIAAGFQLTQIQGKHDFVEMKLGASIQMDQVQHSKKKFPRTGTSCFTVSEPPPVRMEPGETDSEEDDEVTYEDDIALALGSLNRCQIASCVWSLIHSF